MKRLWGVWLLLAVAIPNLSCEKENLLTSDFCVEGVIANDTAYKILYKECYEDLLWVEVKNNENLGKDIEIYTPSPVLYPNQPIQYSNVLEIPVPDFWKTSHRRDTLLGRKIYFNYRAPSEAETISARHNGCEDMYQTYHTELVVITRLSFENCSDLLENK